MLTDDPDLDEISDFSKTIRENTELFGLPTVFEISVLQVSCGDFDLSNERMPRGTMSRQRERKEREGSAISVAESMSKKLGVILFRLTKNSVLVYEISENTLNEELKLFLNTTEYNMEIQNFRAKKSEKTLFE